MQGAQAFCKRKKILRASCYAMFQLCLRPTCQTITQFNTMGVPRFLAEPTLAGLSAVHWLWRYHRCRMADKRNWLVQYPEGKKRVPNTVQSVQSINQFCPSKKKGILNLPGFYHPARPVCLGEFSQRSCGVQFASGWACPSILSMETSWRTASTSLASPGKIVECYLDSLCSRGHLLLNWDWWDCLKNHPRLEGNQYQWRSHGSIWNSYGIINFSLIVKEMNLRQLALMVGGLQYRILLVGWSLKTSLQRHTWLLTAYIIILVQCYTVLYSYVPIYTTTKWYKMVVH